MATNQHDCLFESDRLLMINRFCARDLSASVSENHSNSQEGYATNFFSFKDDKKPCGGSMLVFYFTVTSEWVASVSLLILHI